MASNKPAPIARLTHTEHDFNYMRIDLAVQQRDVEALRRYVPVTEEMAMRDGHMLYQASAHRAWGVLYQLTGEYSMAEDRLLKALELFQELETRWQIGRTLFELAELAMAKKHVTEARDHYRRALASFEEMDARPDVTRTQAALASLGN